MLHDLVYQIVEEICWDRDYLYRCFTEVFSELMNGIYRQGCSRAGGNLVVNGVKSDVEARISWRLQHQLDYFGPNALKLEFEIRKKPSGLMVRTGDAVFDLATGCDVGD